jgi:hypothetical protein
MSNVVIKFTKDNADAFFAGYDEGGDIKSMTTDTPGVTVYDDELPADVSDIESTSADIAERVSESHPTTQPTPRVKS